VLVEIAYETAAKPELFWFSVEKVR